MRALCRTSHERTIFGDIPFSDAKFGQTFAAILARSRQSVGLVAELDCRIVGAESTSAGEYHIGEGEILTTVHLIAIEKSNLSPVRRARTFLRLIRGLRLWSDSRSAKRLLIHVTTGHDLASTDRLLKVAGMKLMGGGYVG